jgi:hypothetical protein
VISDVLCDAVAAIDGYLESPLDLYQQWYSGSLRDRIIKVRNDMDLVRQELDASGLNTPVPNFLSPEAVEWVDVN